MRELKFRAWFSGDKEMQYNIGLSEEGFPMYLDGYVCDDDNAVVMQYTGIKDKNGVEIYEGDITTHGVVKYHAEVNFESGGGIHPGFYFDSEDLEYDIRLDSEIEVLGNKYEDPELL